MSNALAPHTMRFDLESSLVGDELHLLLSVELPDISQYVTRRIIKLEEQAVRDALIKLGWTPPEAAR